MKKSQKSLRDWTNQKWRTSDGSPSKGKKRYLPDAAWKALSPGEKAATNRAKAKGDKKGKQFVKQPKNIAKKTAKYRAMGGLISSKFQNGGQLPKTPYDIRSTDVVLPGAKEPSTVLMESGGYDNKEYAYPTLFPKDPKNPTNNPKDWMQLSGEAAFMEAKKRGELWEFSTAEEADSYARGSWKTKPQQKQMGGTLPYVAPDLLEVEITPEGTELKDQPKELEAYYRDYAAQYPVTDKKDITKQYKERARNYAAEQLLKANPQGDRNRKDWLNSFTSQELAVLRNSESKGKVNPTLMQKFEGALKQGAAAGAPGDLRYKKVETESLTDEEMKDVGALDLLGPLSIPAKLVQAGYKDGYSFLDALKGQENNASLIEDIATDPLNLVGIGLVSKGASAAKLLKAYKNLSKLSNAKRTSTLQNAYKLNPLNERLRNNPSYVINPEVRSTEKLAKESEPYLKSSTPPRSRQDEIVEGFAPGLRQERIERTTVNFNPDGSEIGKNFKSEIDWAKWNKDIPNNKPLIKEYNAIEEATKADGTWMKNADGSEFTGTPEQFVQQQSKNFKAAFGESKLLNPDGSPTIQYHGTAKEFDTFDPDKFQLGDSGYSGLGIYTTPNKTNAESYALSSAKFHTGEIKPTVMELYGLGKNPVRGHELPEGTSLFTFHRPKTSAGNVPIEEQLLNHDVAIRTQRGGTRIAPDHESYENVFPTNTQLKSAVGNNGMFDMTNPNIYKSLAPIVGVGAAGTAMSQEKAMGGTLDKSVMGYRDDSPYKNEPYIDINTPTGEIDMSKTGVSLYANGKLLKPYSGKHKFNTSKVREVPVSNSWLDKYK